MFKLLLYYFINIRRIIPKIYIDAIWYKNDNNLFFWYYNFSLENCIIHIFIHGLMALITICLITTVEKLFIIID